MSFFNLVNIFQIPLSRDLIGHPPRKYMKQVYPYAKSQIVNPKN